MKQIEEGLKITIPLEAKNESHDLFHHYFQPFTKLLELCDDNNLSRMINQTLKASEIQLNKTLFSAKPKKSEIQLPKELQGLKIP